MVHTIDSQIKKQIAELEKRLDILLLASDNVWTVELNSLCFQIERLKNKLDRLN